MSRLQRSDLERIVGSNPRAIREFERLLNAVQANISGPSAIAISYSSEGAIVTPLPALYSYTLTAGDGTAFRSGVSWGVTVLSGAFDGAGPTVGGTGTGILQINSGLATSTVTVAMTARVNGQGYPAFTVTLTKSIAAAGGGGGGMTASDSTTSFTVFGSGSFVAVTRDLAVTLPTGVTAATLTAASLDLKLANAAPDGDTTVEMKWQRETAPAVWTDIGAVATSSPDPYVEFLPAPPLYFSVDGSITCNRTETGMAAGSAQKFRLVARVSAGNVRNVTIVGTAAVTS
jgi:hypothetical protein